MRGNDKTVLDVGGYLRIDEPDFEGRPHRIMETKDGDSEACIRLLMTDHRASGLPSEIETSWADVHLG